MKTTLILSTLILFAAFMGCSDNLNVTDPLNEQNHTTGQQKHPVTGSGQVIWELSALSVSAGDELMVENKAVYINPPFTYIASYMVTFDVYTDADKFTNGYRPLVKIFRDEEVVYEDSNFPDNSGSETTHKEIRLNNVRFTDLTIYIALFQGDDLPIVQNGDVTTLKLTDIKIYRFD